MVRPDDTVSPRIIAAEALPLARQLIEEREQLLSELSAVKKAHGRSREKNERLKEEVEELLKENHRARQRELDMVKTAEYWEHHHDDLQSRLSEAERKRELEGEQWKFALSAAEKQVEMLTKDNHDIDLELRRAEEVVKAVKEAQADWLPDDDPISVAVRRYEEGKDAPKASPVVLP